MGVEAPRPIETALECADYSVYPEGEMASMNVLYYGDNLEILQRYVDDESVDLVYLDPPFKSDEDYNVLFEAQNGSRAAAQVQAFEDTWRWDRASAEAFQDVVERGGKAADAMVALRKMIGENDVLAYLSMMAPRLIELRRVLKPSGTLWLHCDPTASHYLKILLDAVFGPENFLNEITWKRSSAHSDVKQGMRRCGRIRDIILAYAKSEDYTWNPVYVPYDEDYLEQEYRHVDDDGRHYKETDLTAAKPGGETEYEWPVKRRNKKGAGWIADLDEEYEDPKDGWEYKQVPPYKGRYWAYSKEKMKGFAEEGKLIHRRTGMPRLKQYADEMPGVPVQNLWDDITPELGKKDLGYPTQKPQELLERIIKIGTDEGDTVLDPFCGCGTAIEAAETLDRHWIGVDITHLAISLIKHRLQDAFEEVEYEVVGEPTTLEGAKKLAEQDPYQFQWWALGLVGARPVDQQKGADQGVDGRLYFFPDQSRSGSPDEIIFSVKSGNVTVSQLRDLVGVVDREDAAIGVFITLEPPTRPMREEAASAGFYRSPELGDKRYPKIQILTIEELLEGKKVECPAFVRQGGDVTFKKAPRADRRVSDEAQTKRLDDYHSEEE